MFISSSPLVGYFAVSHGLILKSNFSSRLPRHNSLSSYVFAFQWTLAYSIAFQRHSAKSRFLWTFILCVEHKNIPYSPWTRGGLGPRLSEHWGVAAAITRGKGIRGTQRWANNGPRQQGIAWDIWRGPGRRQTWMVLGTA